MKLEKGVSLANLTTMAVGGRADYFIVANSVGDIQQALALASKKNLPVFVLGGGSNVVFADAGWPGLVIKINLRGKKFIRRGNRILAEIAAGENWDKFVKECVQKNYAGVECLAGIPGLVGAVPIQNVGAYGQEVADTILSVRCLDRKILRLVNFKNSGCGFGYRASRFKTHDRDRYIILSVLFRLIPNGKPILKYPELVKYLGMQPPPTPEAEASLRYGAGPSLEKEGEIQRHHPSLLDTRRAVLALRRRKSMVLDKRDPNTRSCGSFFTNPIISQTKFKTLAKKFPGLPFFPFGRKLKIPAAWLVENAGFIKGYKYGGVGISTNHSLAIVNLGRGRAREIIRLAEKIRKAVKNKFGINLEPEPNIISPPRL